MLYFLSRDDRGERCDSIMHTSLDVPSFSEFCTRAQSCPFLLKEPVPKEALLVVLDGRERREILSDAFQGAEIQEIGVAAPCQQPPFSINEFARLMVLLRDDEHARSAAMRDGRRT